MLKFNFKIFKKRLFVFCTLGFYLDVCLCEDARWAGTGVTGNCGTAMWMLAIEPSSFERVARALNR